MSRVFSKKQINSTLAKRKRGLLKKAIELSTICNQDVYIVIVDESRKRMVEFKSSTDFDYLWVTKNSNLY